MMEDVVRNLDTGSQELVKHAARIKKKKLAHSEMEEDKATANDARGVDSDDDLFFETVSSECRERCIASFIDATGNEATRTAVCSICARRFFMHEIVTMSMTDLAITGRLTPHRSHPAHVLTDGMLLHASSDSFFSVEGKGRFARSCKSCFSQVQKKKTPVQSLANGLWIGALPMELKILTLPERILIARHFPAAYIVKLYPKKKGARTWSNVGFHSALQGNVSTYRLNTNDIAKLMGDGVMPPHASILAATVGVTFVGPKNLPERTLPGFLRVNRARVRSALQWLKANNPVYHQVTISTDRLNELPVDDVPDEISSLARHSEDASLLAQENDGYVPEDCVERTGMCHCFHLPKTNLPRTQNLKMIFKEISKLTKVNNWLTIQSRALTPLRMGVRVVTNTKELTLTRLQQTQKVFPCARLALSTLQQLRSQTTKFWHTHLQMCLALTKKTGER